MSVITPLAPLLMKEAVLSLGSDDFAAAVSSMTLTPSSSTVSFKGLKPTATYTDVTAPTWTCDVTFVQDWSTNTSLSYYLWTHQGETVNATFTPKAGGRSWTVKLVITPGAIGGAIDGFAEATVSLGVSGQPVPSVIA